MSKRFPKLSRFLTAGLLSLGVVGLGGAAAEAGGYGCYNYCYKYVTCYEYRQVPYTVCETYYDHCGYPYHVNRTYYKTVSYPVTKLVKVYH